jgi:hypothetical protein
MCDCASARFDPQCIACAALGLNSLRPVPARGGTHRHLVRVRRLRLGLSDLLRLGLLRLHRMRAWNSNRESTQRGVPHDDASLALRWRRNTSGVGADLRRLFGRLILGLPEQNE